MLGSVHDGDHDGVVRIFVGISYVGLTGLNTEHQFFYCWECKVAVPGYTFLFCLSETRFHTPPGENHFKVRPYYLASTFAEQK